MKRRLIEAETGPWICAPNSMRQFVIFIQARALRFLQLSFANAVSILMTLLISLLLQFRFRWALMRKWGFSFDLIVCRLRPAGLPVHSESFVLEPFLSFCFQSTCYAFAKELFNEANSESSSSKWFLSYAKTQWNEHSKSFLNIEIKEVQSAVQKEVGKSSVFFFVDQDNWQFSQWKFCAP